MRYICQNIMNRPIMFDPTGFRWLDVQGDNEMVEQEFMLSDILHGEDEEEEEENLTGE